MHKLLGAVLAMGMAILGGAPAAQAGGAADAALALGAFAVFNQLVRGETVFHGIVQPAPVVVQHPVVIQQPVVVRQPVVVYQPLVVVAPPVALYPGPRRAYVAPRAPVIYPAHPPIGYRSAPVYHVGKRLPPGAVRHGHGVPRWKTSRHD